MGFVGGCIANVLYAARQAHPDVHVELTVDDGLTDIVASGYDAGMRFGEKLKKT